MPAPITAARIAAAHQAACDALLPHAKSVQVRARLAESIVTTLQAHSLWVAVEVLAATWPRSVPRIDREHLAEVVQATARALEGRSGPTDRHQREGPLERIHSRADPTSLGGGRTHRRRT